VLIHHLQGSLQVVLAEVMNYWNDNIHCSNVLLHKSNDWLILGFRYCFNYKGNMASNTKGRRRMILRRKVAPHLKWLFRHLPGYKEESRDVSSGVQVFWTRNVKSIFWMQVMSTNTVPGCQTSFRCRSYVFQRCEQTVHCCVSFLSTLSYLTQFVLFHYSGI
jgi:hypothetical protein